MAHLVERVDPHISTGQSLIVWVDDTVGFGVAFVACLRHPSSIRLLPLGKSADIETVHIHIGATLCDPVGQLF